MCDKNFINLTGKTRITIRLDKDVIDWFRDRVELKGAGNYQTMINNVLREYVYEKRQGIEKVLRHVIREELSKFQMADAAKATTSKKHIK